MRRAKAIPPPLRRSKVVEVLTDIGSRNAMGYGNIRREGRAALGARPVEQQQAGAGTGEPRGLGAAERAERTGDEDGLS
jgi:hypothetical protein